MKEMILGQILSCQTQNDPEKWRKPALNEIDETDQAILTHLSNGLTAKEISDKVFVSIPTIKKRIRKMLKSTGSKNATELVFKLKDIAA